MAQLSSSTVFGDLTVTNNINIFGSLNSTSINIGGVRKDENWDIAYTHSQTAHAPSNANYYVHPSVNHIPTGGAAGNILQWSSSGTAAWKANGTTSQYLRGDGSWSTPPNDNTASAVDNILSGSNSGTAITYQPYTTSQAATGNRFYTHDTMPTATTLLNLSSHLRITQGTIGTTLTVNGDIIGNGKVIARTTDGWLRLNPTYTSSPPATAFHSGVLIPSALSVSGNVGIGTTAPAYKLDVSGDVRATGTFRGSLTGNASTATTLATARTINGTSFNGSANITTANWGTSRTITIGSTGKSVNGSANVSWTLAEIGAAPASHNHSASNITSGTIDTARLPAASTSAAGIVQLSTSTSSTSTSLAATASAVKSAYDLANSKWAYNEATIKAVKVNSAGTADTLATARTINGTSFNGSANITTANWGTARTITIGDTGKSVNGSANVSWSLAEIGAAVGDNVSYVHNAGSGARWIRIAEFSHYTSYGIISILNSYSNNPPNSVTFYYNSGYRSASSPSITQIGGRAGIFTKARVVYPTSTNEPGFIEVYYNTTSVGNTLYLRLANSFNCKLLRTATVGSVPSTHTSYEINFTNGGISADTVSANTFYGSLSGNATTATTLATARTINGTSFNGSANITTANWGTARTLTIGSTGKSVNGSANVSWTLAEIGAAPASHTHSKSDVGLDSDNVAIGSGATASGDSSTALGRTSEASGIVATALGFGSSASGDYSIALGIGSSASGDGSTALGRTSEASGIVATALGYSSSASGDYSIALGFGSEASENDSIAIGNNSKATKSSSVALGTISEASGDYSTALGHSSSSSGNGSTALGYSSTASGDCSIALGYGSSVSAAYSTALGYGSSAITPREVILGSTNAQVKVPGKFTVQGTKNFEIPHPNPDKKSTHMLRHGAVESPTAGDTLYRYKVQSENNNEIVKIELPDYFIHLNKNVQIFVTPQGHFGQAYGSLNREDETLEITCQYAGEYNVLVIGTRNDDHESVQTWDIKGVEREVGESWLGETCAFEVNEIMEVEEIKEVN